MIKRLTFFAYGLGAYVVLLATFLYAMAFVGGFGVPTTLDSEARSPLGFAVTINLLLLTVFAVQHSVMARRWFKEWWTQIVPWTIERSTFVLFASLALLLLFRNWQPIGIDIWTVEQPAARVALWTLCAAGFATVLIVTFLIDHFDLFGLSQVWLPLTGKPYKRIPFRTPLPYRVVRHPLYAGFLVAFWATPHMTLAHLLFAVVTTAYIVMAIQFEERDLVTEFGPTYEEYRRRVPMLLPGATALLLTLAVMSSPVEASERLEPPAVPDAIRVPAGHVPFLAGHAVGTQGYVCVVKNAQYSWAPFGPQALPEPHTVRFAAGANVAALARLQPRVGSAHRVLVRSGVRGGRCHPLVAGGSAGGRRRADRRDPAPGHPLHPAREHLRGASADVRMWDAQRRRKARAGAVRSRLRLLPRETAALE